MANPRTKARLEARIHERAAYCLEFELSDPRSGFVTITKVELTQDLGTARIYYSVYGTEGDKSRVKHMLDDASGYVRSKIARVLRIRKLPKLAWFYDDSIEYAAKMDRAIRDAMERDRVINPEAHTEAELTEDEQPEEEPVLDSEDLDSLKAREAEGKLPPPE